MRFYSKQPRYYGGIDLHARTMDVCLLDQGGEILLHRTMKTSPDALLNAIAPDRDQMVVAAECMCTWDLARRFVRRRRHPVCPRPCPLHEGHPWR
jgi:hypothetical protein